MTLGRDPLNDTSVVMRLFAAGVGSPVGMVLGMAAATLVSGGEPPGTAVGWTTALMLGNALLLGGVGGASVIQRVGLTRLVDRLVAGGHEIASGQVVARTVPARGVRVIPVYRRAAAPVLGAPPWPRAHLLVTVALTDDGPRRVGVLLPSQPWPWRRGSPLALALHPRLPDVAVLDARVPVDGARRTDADGRWHGRWVGAIDVAGGWRGLLLAAAASVLGLPVVCALVALLAG